MNKTHLKRAMALTLVVTLVLCQSFVTGTPLSQVVSKLQHYVAEAGTIRSAAKLPRAASLSVRGPVTLNGFSASDGATVFSGGGIKTTQDSTAVLSFGQMGQVELASASNFTLALEGTTLGGQLRAGRATIVAPAGVAVKIVTADGPILTDGKDAVVLTIDVTSGKTRVESSRSLTGVTTPAGVERQATDQQDIDPQEALRKASDAVSQIQKMQTAARQAKDVIKLNCLNDKLLQVRGLANVLEAQVKDLEKADQNAIKSIQTGINEAAVRVNNLLSEAQQCVGENVYNPRETQVNVAPPVDAPVDPPTPFPTPTPTPTPAAPPVGKIITITTAITSTAALAAELANKPSNSNNNTLSPIR
ncbi:MAG: hypothetical protein JNM09_12620 [Blastocatellia bacterium]|nr:hypothetical protein [Blastocatellia bacterium]